MSKTREIACVHYICEGNCDLGKEGTFRKHCQICKTYKKIPGGKPARTDNRRQKMDKINKKEMNKWKGNKAICISSFNC